MLCLDASYLNWKGTWDCQMPVCLCLVRKDSIGKGTFIRDLRGLFLLAHAASLFFCGSLLGSLVVGLFAEQLGRRKGILFGTSASLGGNLLLVFAQSVAMAMIARVIMGVAFGVQLAQVSVYTSEVSQPVLRPVVGGLAMCCITIGFALAHFVGALVRWRFMVMVNTSICGVVLLVQIFILVESHKWLMQKGREAEARKILSELRHNEDVVEEELDSIEFNIREQKKRKTSYASFIQESNISKFQTFIGIFTKGTFVRPFIVALFVRTAPIFNGLLVINQFPGHDFGAGWASLWCQLDCSLLDSWQGLCLHPQSDLHQEGQEGSNLHHLLVFLCPWQHCPVHPLRFQPYRRVGWSLWRSVQMVGCPWLQFVLRWFCLWFWANDCPSQQWDIAILC